MRPYINRLLIATMNKISETLQKQLDLCVWDNPESKPMINLLSEFSGTNPNLVSIFYKRNSSSRPYPTCTIDLLFHCPPQSRFTQFSFMDPISIPYPHTYYDISLFVMNNNSIEASLRNVFSTPSFIPFKSLRSSKYISSFLPNIVETRPCTGYIYNKRLSAESITHLSDAVYAVFNNFFNSEYNKDYFSNIFYNQTIFHMAAAVFSDLSFQFPPFKRLLSNLGVVNYDVYQNFSIEAYYDWVQILNEVSKKEDFWINHPPQMRDLKPIPSMAILNPELSLPYDYENVIDLLDIMFDNHKTNKKKKKFLFF